MAVPWGKTFLSKWLWGASLWEMVQAEDFSTSAPDLPIDEGDPVRY